MGIISLTVLNNGKYKITDYKRNDNIETDNKCLINLLGKEVIMIEELFYLSQIGFVFIFDPINDMRKDWQS